MEPIRRARPLLGTIVSIDIRGPSARDAHRAVASAFEAIEGVHRLMSFHEAGSDVNRLNRGAIKHPVQVDARTFAVLASSLRFAAASAGAFDITVARELVEYGFLPRPDDACTPDPAASWRDIELIAPDRVRFHRPLWIDVGGIAKGYAVDEAIQRLQLEAGMQLCINAGGDLRVCGPEPQAVYLQVPSPQVEAPLVLLQDGSLASSTGRQQRQAHGRALAGPHIDGVYRRAVGRSSFVAVLAPECLVADALTKVVMACGSRAEGLLRRCAATAYLHDAQARWRRLGAGT